MKKYVVFLLVLILICDSWSIPKPMESIKSYNVLMVHGAYGWNKGFIWPHMSEDYWEDSYGYEDFKSEIRTRLDDVIDALDTALPSAYDDTTFLGKATLGSYTSDSRITRWLNEKVFEEKIYSKEYENVRNSYIYNWRSFSNPANSSSNNAHELGDRAWNKGNLNYGKGGFGRRRALMEEAQEVKALVYDSTERKYIYGQTALDSIRKYPDLYRQLASRYILIGHSMGGVVSREYVQSNFYNGDVDKIITLDSPHEGTGALNMQVAKEARNLLAKDAVEKLAQSGVFAGSTSLALMAVASEKTALLAGLITFGTTFILDAVSPYVTRSLSPEIYYSSDSLVRYVDPKKHGYGTIDSLNGREYDSEKMPMFRILGGRNGMTFTDPTAGSDETGLSIYRALIPDDVSLPFENFFSQITGNSEGEACYVNSVDGLIAGLIGISIQDNGSSIVPDFSSEAKHVGMLHDERVDVKRGFFNAAPHSSNPGVGIVALASLSVDAMLALEILSKVLGIGGAATTAGKIAIGVTGAVSLAAKITPAAIAGFVDDLANSHTMPLYTSNLDTMKTSKNLLVPIESGESSYTPYLMEDFLYEQPFVNLAMLDTATLSKLQGISSSEREKSTLNRNCFYLTPGDSAKDAAAKKAANCAVGLFYKADDLTSAIQKPVSALSELKFHSSSDWSKMGMKVDRWERVDGLKPDGSDNPGGVPIRHVERYEVPAITVEDWIEKYSFVVDDLMPHRLRQIKMNFNYQEEIAWECDIKKDSDANDACTVYKRTSGSEWTELRKEKHPVKKNGQFDFEPRKYGYDNLLAIQKDNQNTVTISTVNKIGLSNTQRFYYLFKATENYLVPIWPKRDVVVNAISGFEAYASVLDYQGFDVIGMRDSLWYLDAEENKTVTQLQDMVYSRNENSGKIYGSAISKENLAEKEYHWTLKAITHNANENKNDSSDIYDVPFRVDVTAPVFDLSVDELCVNPDSSMFVARFDWGDSSSPDIRIMRFQLEQAKENGYSVVANLPSLNHVSSKDFAIAWDKVSGKEKLTDGLYRVKATAIDYAVPNLDAYDFITDLETKIILNDDSESDWEELKTYNFNKTEKTTEFRVDRTAPEFSFENVVGLALDSFSSEKYASFKRPSRNEGFMYVSEDSLLDINYSVKELLGGRDSTVVTVSWQFIHAGDTSKIDRAGDSVVVKESFNKAIGKWTEMSNMRLQDGDYILRAVAKDEAKNLKKYQYEKQIRIDRTPPKILSLVSNQLIYPDSVTDFSATLVVSEKDDLSSNRTGMYCYYRVLGSDANETWYSVTENILKNDTIGFNILADAVGKKNGKRYLETVCLDAAGNESVRSDLFYLGKRYPIISSPQEEKDYLTKEYIPIVGIAPPVSITSENTTVYRLRYRLENSNEWLTDNIEVVKSNQSKDSAHISKISQSTEGILGYFHNVGLSESRIIVELSTRSCSTCEWLADTTSIVVDNVSSSDSLPSVVFEISSPRIEVGKDSLEVSIRLGDNVSGEYYLRVYAEDSKGTGLFEKSAEYVTANPFMGEPQNTDLDKGVWFYEKDGLYHLEWNGFESLDSVNIYFDSNTFGQTCLSANGNSNLENDCKVSESSIDVSSFQQAIENYTLGFLVWQFPIYTDKVMTLYGAKGHVVMSSKGAFYVGKGNFTKDFDIPVYFGSSTISGFNFMGAEYASINPWHTGWTIHPNHYGLRFVWDGLYSGNLYPASGNITLHAEVIENTLNNPQVILMDTVVSLTLPEMEVALTDLPDFYMMKNASDSFVNDSSEKKVFEMDSVNISYGILYKDAIVSVDILDANEKLVKRLQNNVLVKASTNQNANSCRWGLTDSLGIPVEPGRFSVVVSAHEIGKEDSIKFKTSSFALSLKTMLPDPSKKVNLLVAEAFEDNGKNRYIPIADYLVRADLTAKYLPKENREEVNIDMDVSGEQEIYGYAPERFSLAIKRHRQQLDLVVVRRLHTNIEYVDCGWLWGAFGCSEKGQRTQGKIYIDTLTFSSDVRTGVLNVRKVANDNDEDFGYDDDKYSENYLDMVVFTMAGWKQFLDGEQIDDVKNEKQFENAINSQYNVWNLSKITSNSRGFVLPPPESGKQNYTYPVDKLNENCSVVFEDSIPTKFCTYGDSGTTAGYDPNANLFVVRMSGIENGDFYALKEKINSSSNKERYRFAYFNIELKIPKEYWDAPFGMDNLVNRTIRFDHTNKTIFGTESDGYWNALSGLCGTSILGNYFDGTNWECDNSYGLLTPYEMQYLPFLPGNQLDGGKNIFLFADENKDFMYPSYFDLKFYGPKNSNNYFQALALGTPLEENANCDYNKTSNIDAAYGHNPRCQISLTSLDDSVRTPLFAHGNVSFYVGKNMKWNNGNLVKIPFPIDPNWLSKLERSDKPCDVLVSLTEGAADCYKYYDGGSKIHHSLGDFSEKQWLDDFTLENGFIKNEVNSPAQSPRPNAIYSKSENELSEIAFSNLRFKPESENYENEYFFIPLDSIIKIKNNPLFEGITFTKYDLNLNTTYWKVNEDTTKLISLAKDTLYKNRIYREGSDSIQRIPTSMKSTSLPIKYFYKGLNSWTKEPKFETVEVLHLDSSAHSHFNISSEKNALDRIISYKPFDSIHVQRPKELVELKANLTKGNTYKLSYLKQGVYYFIKEFVAEKSGNQRIAWFDMNRLQGNTQFMLTWGASDVENLFYSTYNLYVGTPVKVNEIGVVESLFGELSVTFPVGSVEENEGITVRTIEKDDYPFEVFNDMPLTGPVMEVLPSMEFKDSSNLPRIQMRISKNEMESKGVTPQTLKLYKIDFENKKIVPLENALYGYLKADGSAAVSNSSSENATCSTWDSELCYPGDENKWEYILISAETKTFSVFAAMSSKLADVSKFNIEIMPEIATDSERILNVRGLGDFVLYVDDDSLKNDSGDKTPATILPYTSDSNGLLHVSLPDRNSEIDTNYIFVIALGEIDSEGKKQEFPIVSAKAKAFTVPSEFICTLPSDSLWLGLDNGYMAYSVSCNHPGYGFMSLYQGNHAVAEIRTEIPDTIIYNGIQTIGNSFLGKIPSGIYESRYIGVSYLGNNIQMAGPLIYTDSVRPVIKDFSVQDSSEILDRIFAISANVSDSESGIANVIIAPVFGLDSLPVIKVLPDSTGQIFADVKLSRKQLSECIGCLLSIKMRVEDYGHNYSEKFFVTEEKLYPYPTELSLWYPARENSGKIVHEFLGTGHNLNLINMTTPWLSDAGLYFGNAADYTKGEGVVYFGSSSSYSFEARIKRGSVYNSWRRILGFSGQNGLNIELMQRGNTLKLVENSHSFETESLDINEKSWSHIVVTVDSAYVKFYVDGELKQEYVSTILKERELEGVFSLGKNDSEESYLGNVADIRMYSRALTATEVEELSKPVTDSGEISDIIVVAVNDMDVESGFSNEFSCSVAGNKYLVSGDSATLAMTVIVENSADYNVVLYARSATVGNKPVYVGESILLAGMANFSNTWRAVTVSGASVHLEAGAHTLTLKVPAGIQIGGVTLTTANVPASMIAWGISSSDKVMGILPADTARKIKSYLRYEGYPETSTLRPRIRLRNVSNEPVNGFFVRYYFRGEDVATAGVERYWPNNVETFPAIHSESANTGFVEWKFADVQIPANGTVFGGEGPHFGLYNADYSPWNASDDPSFVDPNSGVANIDGFYEDVGIIVLDNDNNLIGGSCAEMEDPVSLKTKVRVLASDIRNDNQSSEIHIKVENTGNVALKNFDVRYYLFVEEGLAPVYEVYDKSECASASMENLGSGRWQVTVHCDKPLVAGKAWQNPVKIALHLPSWVEIWNANDDPSHDSLDLTLREAHGICVFDSTGYMLYGNEPIWTLPTPDEDNSDFAYDVDFGYHSQDNFIPVIRTPDGLVLMLDNWTYVELSLVTALGTPVKSIFNGTLASGEQFVHVDWTGIDMSKMYLMLKVNGTIKSTKKLSLL